MTGNPTAVEQVYKAACLKCHAATRGGLLDPTYLALISDGGLRTIVVAGKPEQGMPDWHDLKTGALSDQNIVDVVAFLSAHRTTTPGQPFAKPQGAPSTNPTVPTPARASRMDEFDELAPPEQRAHDQAGPPSPMDAPFPSSAEHSQKHTRRIFLFKLSLGLNALVGAVLAVPILGYVLAPMFKKDNSYNQGALVFQHKQCRNCHALEGVGGQRGPALDKIAARMSDDQLIRQVLQGGGNMPAFGKSLTPAETTALVSFLGTLPRQRKRE